MAMIEADLNKRAATRSRVLKGAKILHMNQLSVSDCTVRDLSQTGAKLMCGNPMQVPTIFRLLLPNENTIQEARVVWRREGMIGVEFTGEKTRAPVKKI
jgi:hypothetical protein